MKEEKMIPSFRQFAIAIDAHPQCINEILKGKRNITLEMTRKAVDLYLINPSYLYYGTENMFISEGQKLDQKSDQPFIVVDQDNEEKIVHVPISAQAGYGNQLHDPIYFKELPTFSLPDYKQRSGTHRCFDVSGDSMEPTIYGGEKIVCSYVEKEDWFTRVKNNFVYVVITQNDVLVKRIVNRLRDNGTIELFSDNTYYQPYIMEGSDVVEIWQVNMKISPFMPSPSNQRNAFHEDIGSMKDTITQQSQLIKNLNQTIEKLLKQNRSRP
jgi:phage repressor protein C with HTH and peptisase S24 domain